MSLALHDAGMDVGGPLSQAESEWEPLLPLFFRAQDPWLIGYRQRGKPRRWLRDALRFLSMAMKAINPSKLYKKRLGDHVVNPYLGCEHACAHCYCPAMPGVWAHNGGRMVNAD